MSVQLSPTSQRMFDALWEQVSRLSPEHQATIAKELRYIERRNQLEAYEPYRKQRLFHELGRTHRIRGLFGGNQSGKSICGGAETAFHLTGLYPKPGQHFYSETWPSGEPNPLAGRDIWPDGWTGHRFDRPIRCWAAGLSGKATRDNVQTKLIGPPEDEAQWGTGFIPADCFNSSPVRDRGTANLLDTVAIKHASGGVSSLWFKTYEQGRNVWQGPTLDLLWFDEECPWDIWSEGQARTTAVRDARIVFTFTPLLGRSKVVDMLLGTRSVDVAMKQYG